MEMRKNLNVRLMWMIKETIFDLGLPIMIIAFGETINDFSEFTNAVRTSKKERKKERQTARQTEIASQCRRKINEGCLYFLLINQVHRKISHSTRP